MNGGRYTAKYIAITALLFLTALTFGIAVGWQTSRVNREAPADTIRVTVTDTIPYYKPVPVDSVVLRYVTRTLPVSAGESLSASDTAATESQHTVQDSVAVEVPISQKVYETDAYKAYVSGYEPNLDSIFVYEKTVTETITTTGKPRRTLKDRFGFGIGVGAGYGIIHKQADIYVGANVSFRIWP